MGDKDDLSQLELDPGWWRSLFMTAPDPCWLIQADHFVECNQAAADALGAGSREEVMTLRPWEVSPEHQPDGRLSKESALEKIALAREYGKLTFDWTHQKMDGSTFPVEVSLRLVPGTDILHVAWRDRTQEVADYNEIRRQAALLGSTLNGLGVAAFTVDKSGRVSNWNRACEKLTGASAEEMIGTNRQWAPFYSKPRPTLADMLAQGLLPDLARDHYGPGAAKPSEMLPGAWEASGHFPLLGGKHLFFTAAPLLGPDGEMVGAIETLQDISEQQRLIEHLKEAELAQRRLALTDRLTGLGNARHFELELSDAVEEGGELSLALFDIDDFKKVNDERGHPAGDEVLARIGALLSTGARSNDGCFRYGGEEFVVLMRSTSLVQGKAVIERFVRRLEHSLFGKGSGKGPFKVTVSVGIASRRAGESGAELLARADAASYEAKRAGKDRIALSRS